MNAVMTCMFLFLAATPSTTWIDFEAGWRFRPAEASGSPEWAARELAEDDWAEARAGERWEEQGFPEVDGYAWYRRKVEIPADWKGKPVWLTLGGVNDACEIYCNGRLVNSYGDHKDIGVSATPLIALLSEDLEYGVTNTLAIRCFDWGGSGGLWHLPCALTTEMNRLPLDTCLLCFSDCDKQQITVNGDLTGLGNAQTKAKLTVKVTPPGKRKAVARKAIPFTGRSASWTLPWPADDISGYRIQVSARGAGRKPVAGLTLSQELSCDAMPSWPGQYAALKALNNFVTELLDTSLPAEEGAHIFPNPRAGWVFIRVEAGAIPPEAYLDGRQERLVWRQNPDDGAAECMQFLTEGKHRLVMKPEQAGRLRVSTVPELAFCYYPSGRHIAAYPEYDWAYMARHVLPHVNTLITTAGKEQNPEFEAWRSEGRQWISNASLPGLGSKEAPTSDAVFQIWAENPGVKQPGFGGMIVDEFLWAGIGHYQAWGEAVQRIGALPEFQGKKFYAWCGDLSMQKASLDFSRMLIENGQRFAWEIYQCEEPDAEQARSVFLREVARCFEHWKTRLPGIEGHMVLCPGYLSAPPESLNLDPGVDYHVFLDMQFQIMATHPAFWNLYGVMEYMAAYADEESLRYAHRLFRHYCIEGHRTAFNSDPYTLTHIQNPDFAEGVEGWKVEAAEPGSIETRSMEGFSWLEGRYPRTAIGDTFCCMEASSRGANRIRQRIQGLTPGRLYSVKAISTDVAHLDVSQTLPIELAVNEADVLPEYGFQFPYSSCYSHEIGAYTREHPACFNFHRLVFRAKQTEAELVISDLPGGQTDGMELGFNFVEVQPFHAP